MHDRATFLRSVRMLPLGTFCSNTLQIAISRTHLFDAVIISEKRNYFDTHGAPMWLCYFHDPKYKNNIPNKAVPERRLVKSTTCRR